MVVNDINHIWENSQYIEIINERPYYDIPVVTTKGDIKKASAKFLTLRFLVDIQFNDELIRRYTEIECIKIEYLSEHPFFPLYKEYNSKVLNENVNPLHYFVIRDILNNNVLSARNIDYSFFYKNVCLLGVNIIIS